MCPLSNIFSDINQNNFTDVLINCIRSEHFWLGVILLAVLGIILIYRILYRYPRRLGGISVAGSMGSLFVSARAISDFVKTKETEFNTFTMRKVALLENRKYIFLKIKIVFNIHQEENLPATSEKLQESVLSGLRTHFGIDCVQNVDIQVVGTSMKKNTRFT